MQRPSSRGLRSLNGKQSPRPRRCADVRPIAALCFALLFWIESVPWLMFVVIPAACAIAGFVAGDKAIEVFKHIATWM